MACLHGPRSFAPGRIAALSSVCVFLAIAVVADDKPAASPKPGAPPEKSKAVSYHAAILPILQANCQGCHQPAKASGKLDLTIFKNMLAGGESDSPAVVPGKPDDSYLLEQITPDAKGVAAMPLEKPPLSKGEIDLIRQWIKEGAKDDTPPDTTPPIDAEHPPIYSGPPVITSVDWSPNGELLAVAGYHEVLLHSVVRGSPDPALRATAGLQNSSPGGDLRPGPGAGSGDPRTTLVARLVGMAERIESVRFSPDGKKLAVTGGRPARSGE